MPTSPGTAAIESGRMSIANVRILRLALGTSLALLFSQAFGWPLSFVAPVFTLVILGLPMPALGLKAGIGFVLVLTVSLYAGTLLIPSLEYMPAVGILLLILALFWSFYFTARGGSALLGTFATVGIALSTAVGSVNIDAVFELAAYLSFAALVGVVFVWIAHALLPDSLSGIQPAAARKEKSPAPDLADARWSAYRSLLIVFPVTFWFLLSPESTAYVAVMIKVASMGQQATNSATIVAARSLLASTLIGGIAAIVGWQVLSMAPTLAIYTLFVALAALVMGPRIFKGPGMHPDGATWSYGLLTMLVILAPAVMDGIGGASAGAKFWDRMLMFVLATLYAVVAVYVVDAFRPRRR